MNNKNPVVDVKDEKESMQCIDHLMVEEDAPLPPEPNAEEARVLRRANRKRESEEGEIFPIRLWSRWICT